MTQNEPFELPGDWRRIDYFKQSPVNPGHIDHRVTVESERFNVVLEGSWDWIKSRITGYMLSTRQG